MQDRRLLPRSGLPGHSLFAINHFAFDSTGGFFIIGGGPSSTARICITALITRLHVHLDPSSVHT